MTTRVNKQIIQIVSDRQTAQQTEQAVQRLRDRFAGLQSQLDRAKGSMAAQNAVTRDLARAWLDAARPAAGLGRVNADLIQSETQLRAAVLETMQAIQAKTAAEKAAEQVRRRALREQRESISSTSRLSYATSGIATLAGTVGGAGLREPLAVGAELISAQRSLKIFKAELPQLTSGLTAAAGGTKGLIAATAAGAAATVGFAVAIKLYKDIVNRSREATAAFLTVNQRYAEVIATSTTEQVREAIRENENRNKALEVERERLREFVDQVKGTDGIEGALLDLNDAAGLNLGGYEDVVNRLKEVDDAIRQNIDVNAQLEGALEAGVTAAADMAAREVELAERRREAAAQIANYINERTQREIEMAQRGRDWSSEQLERRLSDIDIERDALEKQRAALEYVTESGDDMTDELEAVNEKLKALGKEEWQLLNITLPLIAAREREAEMAERVRKAFEDGVATSEKYTAALEQFNEETARIEEGRQRTEIRELEDWALKRTRALAEHYRDLASIDAKYYQKRDELIASIAEDTSGDTQEALDRLRDFNKQQRREAEDHRDRLLKIERDRRKGIQAAAAQLDAVTLLNAQEQADEALTDEQQQYEKEKRRREEDFRDRMHLLDRERQERRRANEQALRDLRTQYERERAERIADFNRKAAEEAQDRAIRLQRQQEDWDREDRLRQQQFDQAYEETRKQYNRIRLAAKNALVDIENNFGSVLGRIAANIRSQLGTGSTTGIRQYRLGGEVGRTGIIGAHAGEEVLRAEVARPLRSLMGGRIDQRALLSMAGQMNVSVPVMINLGAGTGRNPFESAAAQRELQHAIERTVVRFVEGRAGGLLGL